MCPIAVRPAFWIVKVKPSACGAVSWNVNLLVKDCTLTGMVQKALATSLVVTESVSWRRVPFNVVCPLNCIPVAEKPVAKLIGVEEVPDCTVRLEVAE